MTPSDMVSFLERDGYWLHRNVFTAAECDRLLAEWQAASAADKSGVLRSTSGAIYGARNVLDLWPDAARILSESKLIEPIRAVLGLSLGLVRVLFFDKPPGESWALPWHKDMAIAVKDNQLSSEHFDHPTTKYAVPHVEAPIWLLQHMLTARVHLDDVTDENGPLRVLPGSHREKSFTGSATEARILCHRGDVLLMRPLLSHSSSHSLDGTTRHRRVFHLEFSGVLDLPDGYRWHTYISTESSSRRQLKAAYLATDYWVDDSPNGPFVIRIDEVCVELEELLLEQVEVEWAFVTACNPFSKQLSAEKNIQRMADLEELVRYRWPRCYPGHGQGRDGEWSPEPSLLILGIDEKAAVNLAKRFEQNAIVVGRIAEPARLVWVC